FLAFAMAADATWNGNFRDFGGAVTRMATLAPGGRIGLELVEEEIARLRDGWGAGKSEHDEARIDRVARTLGTAAGALHRFDVVQLADVLDVCAASASLSAAGRTLFAQSRAKKQSANDADRLRKYLARFGL